MKIQSLAVQPYEISLKKGSVRTGIFIHITDEKGNAGWGEVSPLPNWSQETLEECLTQLDQTKSAILETDWLTRTFLNDLMNFKFLPALSFGIESAILSLLVPLKDYNLPTSALFMGSPQEILAQAALKEQEGFVSAKLKISNHSFQEAAGLINQLKDRFHLRIDVNRAWSTADSLEFFAQFPLDTFDYVEEPFQDPADLALFPHPLAVDESYPRGLSLKQLESLPTLKAIIYKPTIQGGLLGSLPVHKWASLQGISLVLSSSFESDLGLAYVASIAHRLGLLAPIGIGTYPYLNDYVCEEGVRFVGSRVHIRGELCPHPRIIPGVVA
ncbi:MAG: o-succinylbenzoate synthase [Parachlamydia sp.]|nr:MAG: o-succinylbenzoate synthase [Parachlamydia sp.]